MRSVPEERRMPSPITMPISPRSRRPPTVPLSVEEPVERHAQCENAINQDKGTEQVDQRQKSNAWPYDGQAPNTMEARPCKARTPTTRETSLQTRNHLLLFFSCAQRKLASDRPTNLAQENTRPTSNVRIREPTRHL